MQKAHTRKKGMLVRRFHFTLGKWTTEFAKHYVDEIEWIVDDDDDVRLMMVVVLLLLLLVVDDAQWLLKRALQMLPFFAIPVAAVDVAIAVDDTVWPWHALL